MRSWLGVVIVVIAILGLGLAAVLIDHESVTQHEMVHVRSYAKYGLNSTIEYNWGGANTLPDKGQLAQLCADHPDDCKQLANEIMLNEIVGYNMVGVELYQLLIALLLMAIFLTLLLREKC